MTERRLTSPPFFSITIPQHNRTSFLLKVFESLAAQTFTSFEICISDDCSNDGREGELLDWLDRSGLAYVYERRPTNVRYDGNLRAAITLAEGEYVFLLGNDDPLASVDVLERLHAAITTAPNPAVVFTDFQEYESGVVTRRTLGTGVRGAGPDVAVSAYRQFSFVSGILLHTARAHALVTTRWDGSEMYQMFIGTRMISSGGHILDVPLVSVLKDLRLPEERVDSYQKPRPVLGRGIPEQRLPVRHLAALVIDAIRPEAGARVSRLGTSVMLQHYGVLYPFWLLEYRRVQTWRYAAGVARGMRPGASFDSVPLSPWLWLVARGVYTVSTVFGLLAPVGMLRWLSRPAHWFARVSSRRKTTERTAR